jgi:hypothetical protein
MEPPTSPKDLRALLWTARISGTLIAAFVAFMLVGYTLYPQGSPPTPHETLLLTLFTLGTCVGYVIAWRWPMAGGILTWVCIVVFASIQRQVGMAVVAAILGIPGILFIVYGVLQREVAAGGATH